MNLLRIFTLLVVASVMAACAATQLRPEAQRVIASRNPPPQGCKFLGSVVGSQGGFWTGGLTSNQNLAEGSMNDLRNRAAAIGANYVQIEDSRAGSAGEAGKTDVTWNGNAYSCPPGLIGL